MDSARSAAALELPEGGLTGQSGHGTLRLVGRGEVCPRGRGWTPEHLARALERMGVTTSGRTLRRACHRGEIPHTSTAGGHLRIDSAWVARTWPRLSPSE
jgi:hypothetical protein